MPDLSEQEWLTLFAVVCMPAGWALGSLLGFLLEHVINRKDDHEQS